MMLSDQKLTDPWLGGAHSVSPWKGKEAVLDSHRKLEQPITWMAFNGQELCGIYKGIKIRLLSHSSRGVALYRPGVVCFPVCPHRPHLPIMNPTNLPGC